MHLIKIKMLFVCACMYVLIITIPFSFSFEESCTFMDFCSSIRARLNCFLKNL